MGVFLDLGGRVVFEAWCFRFWWCWVSVCSCIFLFFGLEYFFTRDSIDRRCLKILESYSSSFINCFFLLRSLFLLCRWFPYLPLFSLVSVLLVFWMLILLLLLFLILFFIVLCVFTNFFDFWFFVVLDLLMVLCRFGLVGIIIFYLRDVKFCIFECMCVPMILLFFGCIYFFEWFMFPRWLFDLFKGINLLSSLLLVI